MGLGNNVWKKGYSWRVLVDEHCSWTEKLNRELTAIWKLPDVQERTAGCQRIGAVGATDCWNCMRDGMVPSPIAEEVTAAMRRARRGFRS